jgi:predicted  nucleic acid-binding Zn-ribbon protein
MCISCKIYGTHSEGPMAAHELEKISDYFAEIASKINEMDPNLEKRKDQFEELLATVDAKVKEINRTTSQIQADLTQMFQEALRDLQNISRRKLSYLISDQL